MTLISDAFEIYMLHKISKHKCTFFDDFQLFISLHLSLERKCFSIVQMVGSQPERRCF